MKPYNKFPDPTKYKESAYIGEDLFDDPAYELERACRSLRKCVERKLFTLNAGLKSYGITNEQYEKFLSKSQDNFKCQGD